MRIYYATKTGRGHYCGMYGKNRCAHRHKKFGIGQAPLLLSDNLGAGVYETKEKIQKPKMDTVISKLGRLSLGPKKNNIRLDI